MRCVFKKITLSKVNCYIVLQVEESPSTEQVEEAPPSSLEERVEESPAGPPTALEEKVEESPSAPPSELEEKAEESPLAPQTVLEEKVEESPSAPPSTLEEKVDELSPKPATEEKIMEVPPPSKETPSEALTDGQGAEQGPEQGPDSHDSYDSQLKPPVDDTSLLPAEGTSSKFFNYLHIHFTKWSIRPLTVLLNFCLATDLERDLLLLEYWTKLNFHA